MPNSAVKLIADSFRIQQENPSLSFDDAMEVAKNRHRAEIEILKSRLVNQAASSGAPESDTPRQPAPLPRQRHQENEILRVIAELGYDAKALPKDTSGKPGAKAAVRKKLPLFSKIVFAKAWQRLMDDEKIIKPK